MSPASLAVSRIHFQPHALHPDRVRIAALSVAIAANLTVLVAALRPLAATTPSTVPVTPSTTIHWIDPPKTAPPPPVLDVKPLPITAAPVVHHPVVPLLQPTPVVVPSDEPTTAVAVPAQPAVVPTTQPGTAAPMEATLAYRTAPLTFPAQAIRSHMQGEVLLRVLVDEHGVPVQVLIDRSSGYALLDRSAREQVLANWRFEPAVVQGRHVRAWAKVPVKFALQNL